jgi:uncharacterized protein
LSVARRSNPPPPKSAAAALSARRSRARRWRNRLISLAAAGVVAYGGMSFLMARSLIHPPRQVALAPIDFALHPFECTTVDDVRLSGWWHEPASGASATVLLFHGVGDRRQPGMMRILAAAGLRTVGIDFRGHGSSGGNATSFGYHERADVEAAIRWTRATWPSARLGALGYSMGAAALCYASDAARELDALVLQSCYATIEDAYDNRLRMVAPAWLTFLGMGPRFCVEGLLEIDARDLRPIDRIARFAPDRVLIVGGELDAHATPAEQRRLASSLPGCELWFVPEADHDSMSSRAGAEYRRRIQDFFARRLLKG